MRFLFCLFLSAGSLLGGIIASSTFDTTVESWDAVAANIFSSGIPVITGPHAVTFDTLNGNPQGSIFILDPDSNDTFFRAPSAFPGNILAAIGGTLRFDTRQDLAASYDPVDVVIRGGGIALVYNDAFQPTTSWSNRAITLAPGAGWTVNIPGGAAATLTDFQTAFAAVTDLYIPAEYFSGVDETVSLDNVSLNTSDVPEPSTLAVTTLGAAILFLTRRRSLALLLSATGGIGEN